ncbi:MAG: PilZ domain-containing protein [bacterium]
MANQSKPDNKPKDKIELLIGKRNRGVDQRISERIPVEAGVEVFFPLICRGEIVDISREGLSIRFKPDDSPKLVSGQTIPVTLELDGTIVQIPATVRRVESRFGIFLLGMQFDPDTITTETED